MNILHQPGQLGGICGGLVMEQVPVCQGVCVCGGGGGGGERRIIVHEVDVSL